MLKKATSQELGNFLGKSKRTVEKYDTKKLLLMKIGLKTYKDFLKNKGK